jgi:hypothetical protein
VDNALRGTVLRADVAYFNAVSIEFHRHLNYSANVGFSG